jgi:hypothetical protein
MAKGYIYILSNVSYPRDFLKIGLTEKTPDERAKQLQSTGVPTPFVVEYSIRVFDCQEAEKRVHWKLDDCRVNNRREFFKVSLDEAIEVVEQVADRVGRISRTDLHQDTSEDYVFPTTWEVIWHSIEDFFSMVYFSIRRGWLLMFGMFRVAVRWISTAKDDISADSPDSSITTISLLSKLIFGVVLAWIFVVFLIRLFR